MAPTMVKTLSSVIENMERKAAFAFQKPVRRYQEGHVENTTFKAFKSQEVSRIKKNRKAIQLLMLI